MWKAAMYHDLGCSHANSFELSWKKCLYLKWPRVPQRVMGGETERKSFTEVVVSTGNGLTSQVLWPSERGETTRKPAKLHRQLMFWTLEDVWLKMTSSSTSACICRFVYFNSFLDTVSNQNAVCYVLKNNMFNTFVESVAFLQATDVLFNITNVQSIKQTREVWIWGGKSPSMGSRGQMLI